MNEWLQVFTMIVANIGIIYMFRREIRDDQRNLENAWDAKLKHLDNRWYAAIKSIEAEMKDFHEKLLDIERRRK